MESDLSIYYLGFFITQAPVAIVALVGVLFVALMKGVPRRSRTLGTLGFGMILGQSILSPLGQILFSPRADFIVRETARETALNYARFQMGLGLFWGLYRAVSYLLLLLALIFAFRMAIQAVPESQSSELTVPPPPL
ncbi:MAG: hypothetical protein LWX11_02500 [Firmicutes bacterium]|nr:hypothetical protein [Bacillota bacterium]